MIQRYRPGGYGAMVESEDGRYCIYSDHLTALAHERQISDDVVKDLEIARKQLTAARDVIEKVIAHMDGYNLDGSYRGTPETLEESRKQDAACAVNWNKLRELAQRTLAQIGGE